MSGSVTLTDLKTYLSVDGTADDAILTYCITRALGAITAYTRREFATTTGTAYYNRFSARITGGGALWLDKDLWGITSIWNGDGQSIPVGSVWLEPRNEGPPYKMLRLKSSNVWTFNTDSDITLAGTWGFSTAMPQDIQQAQVRLAGYYYRQKDVTQNDAAGFQDAGEVTISRGMPDDVRYLLAPYRSRTGGAV